MKLLKRPKSSILFKFASSILGLLVTSLFLFVLHIHSTEEEMLRSIYQARKKQIEIETEKNIKAAAQNRLELIKLEIERYESELAEALFTVNEERCTEIIDDVVGFPSVKGAELYDLLVDDYYLTAIKGQNGKALFIRGPADLQGLSIIYTELFRNRNSRPVGYLKVFYDESVFTRDARKLANEAAAALDQEFDLAMETLKDNFAKQILSLILIFALLYLAIYFLFSRFINEPIKKLEHNLKCFFNFLANKDDMADLYQLDSDDEFGRMGRFINSGIETSIKIHKELERHAEEVSKLATVLEQSAQSILITDVHGNIEYVNRAFEKTTGYTFEEVKGKNPRILKSGRHPDSFYKELLADHHIRQHLAGCIH